MSNAESLKNSIGELLKLTWIYDQKDIRLTIRYVVRFVLFLVLLTFVTLIAGNIVIKGSLSTPKSDNWMWLRLIEQVEESWYDFTSDYFETTFWSVFLFAVLLFLLFEAIDWFARIFIRWRLFDRKEYLEYYDYVRSEIELKSDRIFLRNSSLLFIVLFIFALVSIIFNDMLSPEEFNRLALWIGILVSLGVFVFDSYFVITKRRPHEDITAIHRYLIWRLTRILVLLFFSLILIHIAIPLYFNWHHDLLQTGVFPKFEAEISDVKAEVPYVQRASDVQKQQFIDWIEDLRTRARDNLLVLKNIEGYLLQTEVTVILSRVMARIIIITILFYFIVPYFFLQRFRLAFIYSAFFLVSFAIEEYLIERKIPELFFLSSEALVPFLFVLLLTFSNTFLSDMLYKRVEEGQTKCPECGKFIGTGDKFCSYCGRQKSKEGGT